jgi:hypothetical protein
VLSACNISKIVPFFHKWMRCSAFLEELREGGEISFLWWTRGMHHLACDPHRHTQFMHSNHTASGPSLNLHYAESVTYFMIIK